MEEEEMKLFEMITLDTKFMLTPSSLLGSLLLVCAILPSRASILTDDVQPRQLRSFPYSVSFYRMLGHDRQLIPYYGVNDEVAALIDSMNTVPVPSASEEVYATRPRRSDGLRGYACRFKFCRIYDA
uniref:Melanin-concentrating hormone n=1 Tax=Caenorhabditis tropicalis TaxID=1561998 RepID=A0A1I7V0S3_9PELO